MLNKDYDKLFSICKIFPVNINVSYTILLEHFQSDKFKQQIIFKYQTRKASTDRRKLYQKLLQFKQFKPRFRYKKH